MINGLTADPRTADDLERLSKAEGSIVALPWAATSTSINRAAKSYSEDRPLWELGVTAATRAAETLPTY